MQSILIINNSQPEISQAIFHLEEAGFSVIERPCVVSALETALINVPGIIITPDLLVGLDALDLLELKNHEPLLSEMAVAIYAESGRQKREFLRLGCDEFFELPIDVEEFVLRIRAVLRRGRGQGVSGEFSHLHILDLIQMLIASGRDGVLDIDCLGGAGKLSFVQGQVISAISTESDGEKKGEEAFLSLLRQSQRGGKFRFVAEKVSDVETNISRRTDHLLLSFANLFDESGK